VYNKEELRSAFTELTVKENVILMIPYETGGTWNKPKNLFEKKTTKI